MRLNKKECKSCGEMTYIFSKGRCKYCAARESYKAPKKITTKTQAIKKERKEILDVYFAYHISKCSKSIESGRTITNPTKSNICHILPKGTHKSVQANLDNCIYLTLEEHNRFDELLFRHDFESISREMPNTWRYVVAKLKIILPLTTEETSLKLDIIDYIIESR